MVENRLQIVMALDFRSTKNFVSAAMGKDVIKQSVPLAIGPCQGTKQSLLELRSRVCAGPPVADFAVDQWHFFSRKLVDIRPFAIHQRLMKIHSVFPDDPSSFVGRFLLDIQFKTNWRGQRHAANPTVRQPCFAI